MKAETLQKAVDLAAKVKHVFLATADLHGWPHLTAAGKLVVTPERHLLVREWFCPGAMANLGMMDGYQPSSGAKRSMPQVERQLLVHLAKITEFKRLPHSDVEE